MNLLSECRENNATEKLLTAQSSIDFDQKSPLFSMLYPSIKRHISDCYHRVENQNNKTINHLFIQGAQGTGKSYFIQHLKATLTADFDLQRGLKPPPFIISLNEYEYGIRSIQGLCQRIQEHIRATTPVNLLINTCQQAFALWSELIHAIQSENRSLILLIDNIDYLLKQLDKDDYIFFVKNISNQNDVLLITAGQTAKKLPNHFSLLTIPVLNKKLTTEFIRQQLLKHTSKQQTQLSASLKSVAHKLEAVRLFTRANIQTLHYFYQGFLQIPEQTSYQYLTYILNQYQVRFNLKMQQLSSQQQPIIHALASQWRASKVANITKHCRLASKTISAQLAQLEKQGWVEKVASTNKNHFYRLTDSLFHLNYIMHFSDKARQQALKNSVDVISYLALEIPYSNEYGEVKGHHSEKVRSRIESYRYRTALKENQDVTHSELDALFSHAFIFTSDNHSDTPTYCDSASQHFKNHLPGERLTFLLNACCRHYEQAYLGLISLLDLADTHVQQDLAYQLKIDLCIRAQTQGHNFEALLLELYLSQGQHKNVCFELSQQLAQNTENIQHSASGAVLLMQCFSALWYGESALSKHYFTSYYTKSRPATFDETTDNSLENTWLIEYLLLLLAKQEWEYLTQIFLDNETQQGIKTGFKDRFLPLYCAFLSLKPTLSNTELNEQASMPTELAAVIPMLLEQVHKTKLKYV